MREPSLAGGAKKRKPSAGASMPLQENISQQKGAAGVARQEELLELRRLVTRTEVRHIRVCEQVCEFWLSVGGRGWTGFCEGR